MPLNRLKHKLTKEVMWLYILTLLEKRPMYGYELKNEIKKHFGWAPATVTSYVVLYKLEAEDYVRTETKDVDNNGKNTRKYYIITDKGKDLLAEGRGFLREILDKLESA